MSRMTKLIGACCLVGSAAVGCSRAAKTGVVGHGVLVIAIDGLRVDHLTCAGYDRDTTPVLDRLARQGTFFEDAYSTAPCLVPSHAALLSGCDPNIARRDLPPGVTPNLLTTWHLPDDAPSLAREFLSHGWETSCFADDPTFSPTFGFSQGFSNFMSCEIDEKTRPRDLGAEGVSTHFEQWLNNRARGENWFAYLHLHDLERTWRANDSKWGTYYAPRPGSMQLPPASDHEPTLFALPRSKWSGNARTLGEYEAEYDGAIKKLDEALGQLFANMKRRGRFDDVTICIVGSYGMSFGESGVYLASGTLSDCDLHVPWILLAPQSRGVTAKRVESLVSTIDLAPTLLALEGYALPDAMEGESLAPFLRGEASSVRPTAFASSGWFEGWSVIDSTRCLERTWPGRTDWPNLVGEWYGDDLAHHDEVREVLHERKRVANRGHLTEVSFDVAARTELAPLGEAWFSRIDRVRREWQSKSWLGSSTAGSKENPK